MGALSVAGVGQSWWFDLHAKMLLLRWLQSGLLVLLKAMEQHLFETAAWHCSMPCTPFPSHNIRCSLGDIIMGSIAA